MSHWALRREDKKDVAIFKLMTIINDKHSSLAAVEFESHSAAGFAQQELWTQVQKPSHYILITVYFMAYWHSWSFFSPLNPQNLPGMVPQPPRFLLSTLLLLVFPFIFLSSVAPRADISQRDKGWSPEGGAPAAILVSECKREAEGGWEGRESLCVREMYSIVRLIVIIHNNLTAERQRGKE